MLWTLRARIQSHQNIKHFQRGLENGVHNEIQWILCCSVLQVETYMLAHKLCIALGVKIALSKDSLAYVKECKCGGSYAKHSSCNSKHKHSSCIPSQELFDPWFGLISGWQQWNQSSVVLLGRKPRSLFFSDDLKNALDKLWDDQRLDLRCLYLRWRSRKSVVLCRAALPLLLIGVVTDCKSASICMSDWGNV